MKYLLGLPLALRHLELLVVSKKKTKTMEFKKQKIG